MSVTLVLARRYLSEYSRRPINLALLALVPLVFVSLASGTIASFARIVGGVSSDTQLTAPTAAWAAAFIAGVAGFFHVRDSHEADQRLVIAGMRPRAVSMARLISGLVLSLGAASVAVLALALKTDISDPTRVAAGTAMLAVIYLGIGAAIGASVRSDVNGSLIVIFVWMLDVFLGPAMAGGEVWITRAFPSHFVTSVMIDASTGHEGPLGDVGWSIAWVLGAIILAMKVFASSTLGRVGRSSSRFASATWLRLRAGLHAGLRDYRRNAAMWTLLILLPVFFISLSFYVTPNDPTPVALHEGGQASIQTLSMIDVHGAIMVPITIAFLAGLAGLFVVQGSLQADARLALAGFRTWEILSARLGIIGLAAAITTFTSLVVTAIDFSPVNWPWFIAGNLVVALTYGMVGVVVGAIFNKLGGLYLMFLLPFIDIGIAQNIMFSAAPPDWGIALPGRGGVDVLVDGAFTATFDRPASVGSALIWLAVLVALAMAVFRRSAEGAQRI